MAGNLQGLAAACTAAQRAKPRQLNTARRDCQSVEGRKKFNFSQKLNFLRLERFGP
jgi:hypothetical protein